MSFTIKSINASTHDYSHGGYPWKVVVVAEVDAKYWKKLRDKKGLGQLYGVYISNAVFAINNNIPARNPTVDDSGRAKAGIKTVELTYYFNCSMKASKLGLKVLKLANGDSYPSYGDYVMIYKNELGKLFLVK